MLHSPLGRLQTCRLPLTAFTYDEAIIIYTPTAHLVLLQALHQLRLLAAHRQAPLLALLLQLHNSERAPVAACHC